LRVCCANGIPGKNRNVNYRDWVFLARLHCSRSRCPEPDSLRGRLVLPGASGNASGQASLHVSLSASALARAWLRCSGGGPSRHAPFGKVPLQHVISHIFGTQSFAWPGFLPPGSPAERVLPANCRGGTYCISAAICWDGIGVVSHLDARHCCHLSHFALPPLRPPTTYTKEPDATPENTPRLLGSPSAKPIHCD